MSEIPRFLNLGCGKKKLMGWVNVDLRPSVEPDLVWNLDHRPFPLPRNHFERIVANDVVEHLQDVLGFMEECHALLVPGGILEITTPHFSCANSFTDPTHRNHLGYSSFDYFVDGHEWGFYSAARFTIVERLLVFRPGRLTNYLARLANRFPATYERSWAWIFPAWFLIFRLQAVKQLPASTA